MLIREAKQEKVEASLQLKRSAINSVKDDHLERIKEVDDEFDREHSRALKGFGPEKPIERTKKVIDTDDDEIRSADK